MARLQSVADMNSKHSLHLIDCATCPEARDCHSGDGTVPQNPLFEYSKVEKEYHWKQAAYLVVLLMLPKQASTVKKNMGQERVARPQGSFHQVHAAGKALHCVGPLHAALLC